MTSLRAALCLSSGSEVAVAPNETCTVRRNSDGILTESLVTESIESAQIAFYQPPLITKQRRAIVHHTLHMEDP